jgi:hypothetical protein
MVKSSNRVSAQHWITKPVALACLLLIAWFAFAEATHIHSFSSTGSEQHCDFCVVIHASASAVPVAVTPAVVLDLAPCQVLLSEETKTKSLLLSADLYIRPPPLV